MQQQLAHQQHQQQQQQQQIIQLLLQNGSLQAHADSFKALRKSPQNALDEFFTPPVVSGSLAPPPVSFDENSSDFRLVEGRRARKHPRKKLAVLTHSTITPRKSGEGKEGA
eukprot:1520513-Amphidinium_carterae.1